MINDSVNTGLQPAATVKSSPTTAANTSRDPITEAELPASDAVVENDQLVEAVTKLNDYVQNLRRTLSFSISETTGRTIIEVYDSETKELIRQIPPDKTLTLAKNINNIAEAGTLFKELA